MEPPTCAATWSFSVDTKSHTDRRLAILGLLAVALCSTTGFASGKPLDLKQSGFDDERAAVRSLLGKDLEVIESSSGRRADIFVATTDLDGDGMQEIVARVVHGGYCGSGGCQLLVLRRDADGAWRPVLETTAVEITVASQQTRGFRDLTIRDGHDQLRGLAWNGTQYVGNDVPPR
jgi:hypothetical protein